MSEYEQLLRSILGNGTPDPLANLEDGTHAIVDPTLSISVFGAHPDPSWTLTAKATWPQRRRADNVWAVLAPSARGLVLMNLNNVDISELSEPIRWCLLTQHARHGLRALPRGKKKHTAIVRGDALAFTGTDRIVRIGTPYTATENAYVEQSTAAFHFLTPALQTVARIIADRGPVTRKDLAAYVYGTPTDADRAALDMTLSRLRQHERITLQKGADGRFTIAATAAEPATDQAAEPVA